ncbi:hypothetical protein [uncultured Jannaschia sp.]|uniref:sodium:calcium antiporter n=1 Tax=uncultured Jannaschia sp. TaxID=293347 RepID=UPI00260766FD|nr:hypothetical protein [uncultured Jannaschia sp.]
MTNWPDARLWLAFAGAGTGIWIGGTALAQAADDLAERLGITQALVGLLLLSVATSLPEIATTLSGAIQGEAEMVVGNLFGGVTLQTAILAVADVWARGAISGYPRQADHVLEASVLIGMLAVGLVAIASGEPLAAGHVGAGAIGAGLAYVGAVVLLRRSDVARAWVPVDIPDPGEAEPLLSRDRPELPVLAFRIALCSAAILVLGLVLIAVARPLADRSGLGTGLLGVTLLAGATSLPELTTTIAAVRLRAYGLAISNVFGSNLIMLGLLLPADLLYRPGPILRDAGVVPTLSVGFGILVTAIYLIGLTTRSSPRVGRIGIDSLAVLGCYALSLAVYWVAR